MNGNRSGRSPSSGVKCIQRASPRTGMSSPARFPTSRDQTPAVQMTVSVRMRPAEVSTLTILSPSTAIRSSAVAWRIWTPCAAAAPA